MVVMVMNVIVLLARIGELSLRGTFVPFRALDLQGLIIFLDNAAKRCYSVDKERGEESGDSSFGGFKV